MTCRRTTHSTPTNPTYVEIGTAAVPPTVDSEAYPTATAANVVDSIFAAELADEALAWHDGSAGDANPQEDPLGDPTGAIFAGMKEGLFRPRKRTG